MKNKNIISLILGIICIASAYAETLTVSTPPVMLTGLNQTINASYLNSGTPISGADCYINFTPDNYLAMSYNINKYQYVKTWSVNTTYPITVNCSKTGYETKVNTNNYQVLPLFALDQTLPGYYESSMALGDYNGDGKWDLFVMGALTPTTADITYYTNNGNSFQSVQDFGIDMRLGNMNFIDYDNDGDLDIFLSGNNKDKTKCWTLLYNNVGGIFSNAGQVFNNLSQSSATIADYDFDGDLDLFFSGYNGTVPKSQFYRKVGNIYSLDQTMSGGLGLKYSSTQFCIVNGSLMLISTGDTGISRHSQLFKINYPTIINFQNLTGLSKGSVNCFDMDNDNDQDILLTGTSDSAKTGATSIVYNKNSSAYKQNITNLGGLWQSSSAFGDINNDGIPDIVTSGFTSGNVASTNIYIHNASGYYSLPYIVLNLAYNPVVILYDYDNDGDLDLLMTGRYASNDYRTLIYKSNYNLISSNTPPEPPSQINVTYANNQLIINWSAGSDTEQGSNGLYYNLRVGTSSNSNDIVSGKYGGSSNPTSGYIGNMQQRRSIALNVTNGHYFVSVQTIDAGLRSGDWKTAEYPRQNNMITIRFRSKTFTAEANDMVTLRFKSPKFDLISNDLITQRYILNQLRGMSP